MTNALLDFLSWSRRVYAPNQPQSNFTVIFQNGKFNYGGLSKKNLKELVLLVLLLSGG
jgi:hypothetical protein